MAFRFRGARVLPLTDEELVNPPDNTAMDPKTFERRKDPGSELLRAVNCFNTPSEFSARNWDLWRQYSTWYLNHINQATKTCMADDGFCRKVQLLNPKSEQEVSSQRPSTSEIIFLLSKMATSLREGKSSLSDLSSALFPLLEGHLSWADDSTDSFSSFHKGQEPLDVQQGQGCQVVFVLLSSMLLLYTPKPSPQPSDLQLQLNGSGHDESELRSQLLRKLSYPLTADVAGQSFEHLLNCFGNLKFQPTSGSSQDHRPIIASNVNYYILSKVIEIRIVWVDYLSLHLEFDRRTTTLKLFRLPALCAMLAIPRTSKATIYDSIFQGQKSDFESYHTKDQNTTPYSQNFFAEVLCSYRILFGQQKNARDLYLEHFRASKSRQADQEADSLRDQICGTPSHKNALFDQIEAFPEKSTYWSDSDFPNLGDRLLELQDFVVSQDSGTLRALWYDVRDLNRFWTFWAVVVFGITSVFLSLIQTVLAGLQLRC